MISNKTSLSVLSTALINMTKISLVVFILLIIALFELVESGRTVSSVTQTYYSFRNAMQNNTGNEFTGEATAWLFGVASIPVFIDLIYRKAVKHVPIDGRLKSFLRRINNCQKKHLMSLHTYLSIAAVGLGILHLTLSSCIANPFPELGLLLTAILVTTGLLFKWTSVPAFLRKSLYKFHANLTVTGILLIILYMGHSFMGLD